MRIAYGAVGGEFPGAGDVENRFPVPGVAILIRGVDPFLGLDIVPQIGQKHVDGRPFEKRTESSA